MVGVKPCFASMCAALPGGGFALPGLRKSNDINMLFNSRRFTKTNNINTLFAIRRFTKTTNTTRYSQYVGLCKRSAAGHKRTV